MIIPMSAQLDTDVRVIPEWTLGWRIQRALAQADLKSGDLEAVFQVSRNTVSRWLNDWYRPKDHVLKQIALMCGVSAEWLQDGDATTPHPAGPNGGVIKPTNDYSSARTRGTVIPLPQVTGLGSMPLRRCA